MTMPKNITKNDIVKALNRIKENGIENYIQSTRYLLRYEGQDFPPKEVVREANKIVGNDDFDFNGGDQTNNYLENFGFEIVPKQNPLFKENHEDGVNKMQNQKEINEMYSDNVSNGMIRFITFHPSYSYEEFVEGVTFNRQKSDSNEQDYMVKNGIFKSICQRAIEKCLINKKYGVSKDKQFDDAIEKFKAELTDKGEIECTTTQKKKFYTSYRNGKTFRIRPESSENDGVDYPANIENIKSLYFKTKELSEIYNPSYVKGILNHLKEKKYLSEAEGNLKNIYEDMTKLEREELFKNAPRYVLIIDEINRGDVSKIFGELITLLEPDKRLGEDNEIIVELPYSNEKFGVPPNVYIIGTMNTADRSLALIDIALRRRFDFQEMPPLLEQLSDNPENFGCSEGLKSNDLFKTTVNALININNYLGNNDDIGKDKKIGHAFFCNLQKSSSINSDIQSIWIRKIWPLLEEYFFFDRHDLVKNSFGAYTFNNGWNQERITDFINGWSKKSDTSNEE
jgi:5-methylcytosine-specific restriction enzyme B